MQATKTLHMQSLTSTHHKMYNREGYLYTHYTCSPACMQHAYNDIRLHNTVLHIWFFTTSVVVCTPKITMATYELDLITQIAM